MDQLPGLHLGRLTGYLEQTRPELVGGPLRAELVAGGRSNLTYRVSDGVGEWVLRRPPLGHVLATAHDMAREYRVITALAPTSVPVPQTLLLCQDSTVLGAPFYLMQEMPGTALRRRADAETLTAAQAGELTGLVVDVLAELHAVDPAAVGLSDFGRPEGFLARQLDRWAAQWAASRSRTIAGLDELRDALAGSVPYSTRAAVVHGDYRLDNVLVERDPLRISAVLDWEMATLGDPLADLGLLVVYWGADATDPITGGVTGVTGFGGVHEVVARYVERSGADVSALDWYVAFGSFKLAVILEGIHFRHLQGKTVGAGFERIGELVPARVESGLAVLRRGWAASM